MRKCIVRLICCFVPSSTARHRIKRKYIKDDGNVINTNPKQYKNNKIVIVSPDGTPRCVKSFPGADIIFDGDNNYIELHEPIRRITLYAHLKSNTDIIIGASKHNIQLWVDGDLQSPRRNRLIVGPDFFSTGKVRIEFKDNADIIIGQDCMFSYDTVLRTTDHHTIIQKGTHKIMNHNQGITIGDHVWVGSGAMILKGSVLPSNTVIGTQSVVAGIFDEPNVIIAGVPARVIKRDIDWDIRDTYTYELENK